MATLSGEQITVMFLSLGILLATARLLGEAAQRFKQPAVLGEILAGILLGPTVLGALAPQFNSWLFPTQGPNALVHNGLTTFAVTLFLLVAGMEVDLSTIFRLRKSALIISLSGMFTPFLLGFGLAWWIPRFLGMEPGADQLVFALFIGISLSVSALPVIAKTLMDLKLYRSDLGMMVIAVAIFYDLNGWMAFAVILGMMHVGGEAGGGLGLGASGGVGMTIGLTLAYAAGMLTLGRWAIHRILPWLQAHSSWPGGVLGFSLTIGLLGAAFTEWIGIHAIFGAFLAGVALGDSSHLQQRTRVTLEQFISFIFAPLFFASIGLRVNFVAHFDLPLTLLILVIACVGQTLGSSVGARWAGFPPRQSWAIGFALNARGAMEIVLALLALQYGVIGERLFVALVVMALVTSMMAGPMMQRILRRREPARFKDYLNGRLFLARMKAPNRQDAILELAQAAATVTGLGVPMVFEAVWQRELVMPTALPNGLAIPHARLAGLEKPLVVVGISPEGIDFDAGDGQAAGLILMVLTPLEAVEAQLEILADIASTFQEAEVIHRALRCEGYTQFMALLNIQSHEARKDQSAMARA